LKINPKKNEIKEKKEFVRLDKLRNLIDKYIPKGELSLN
jgi:DNA polymerase sigma